jgi:hypothetical protein
MNRLSPRNNRSKITHHFRGICGILPPNNKGKKPEKLSTCKWPGLGNYTWISTISPDTVK